MSSETSDNQQVNLEILRKLRMKAENKVCFDCPNRNPDWCTVPYGAWICMDCAGQHRKLGVHLSFVRSPIYDKWSDEQVLYMKLGGNSKARTAFQKAGIQSMKLTEKYSSSVATSYKNHLKQLVNKQLNLKISTKLVENEPHIHSAPVLDSEKQSAWDAFSKSVDEDIQSKSRKTIEVDNEPEFEIKVMKKKDKPTVSKSTPTSSLKKKTSKSLKDRWDDWGDNDNWKEDQEEEEEEVADDDWNNDWAASTSSRRVTASAGNHRRSQSANEPIGHQEPNRSLSSKYGYSSSVQNYQKESSLSDNDPERFKGYGSSPSIDPSVLRNSRRKVAKVDSIQDIQDIQDFSDYVKDRSKELAHYSKEYSQVLVEKSQEWGESLKSWFSNFGE